MPSGTAFFDTSSITSLSFSPTITTVGGWTFNAGASAYSFTNPANLNLWFNGAGIVVNGGSATLTNNGYSALQQFQLGRRRDHHQQRLPVFQRFQHGRQRQLHQQLHCRFQQLQLAWQRHRHQQLLSPDPQHQLGRQRQHHQRQRRQPDLRWNQHRPAAPPSPTTASADFYGRHLGRQRQHHQQFQAVFSADRHGRQRNHRQQPRAELLGRQHGRQRRHHQQQ